ncbi:hypothetical protein BKA62DRAFT_594303, partial [Auriculariales sp. MPI-PUGE-AT-0066]
LPVELLTETLGYLGIDDLLRASHACKRWRVLTRRSRVFWSAINLVAFSNSALDFLTTRLEGYQGSGVQLVLNLQHAPYNVFTIVAPLVSAHLHRLS